MKIYDIKNELQWLRIDMKFLQQVKCSREECEKYIAMLNNGQSLPEGVYQYVNDMGNGIGVFYRIYDSGLSDAEKQEYIQCKKLAHIKTIKNCIVFFTVLTAISLLVTLIALLK